MQKENIRDSTFLVLIEFSSIAPFNSQLVDIYESLPILIPLKTLKKNIAFQPLSC